MHGLHVFVEDRTMLYARIVAGEHRAGIARREARAGTLLTLKLAIRGNAEGVDAIWVCSKPDELWSVVQNSQSNGCPSYKER